jgi:hypothetical protein
MRRFTSACAIAVAALTTSATAAHAQRVLGVGDDALVLPRGALRIRVVQNWTDFNERFGEGTPGRRNGALEPLAVDFNLDTIGLVQFPALAPVQGGLRDLAGLPTFNVSLGSTRVRSDVRISATPIVAELGLTRRLSLGVQVPIVQTRNEIFFDVNGNGRDGNVAFNPAFDAVNGSTARTANTNLVNGLNAAAAAAANSADPVGQCTQTASSTCELVRSIQKFAGGIAQIYGTATAAGSPFVPIQGTEAQLAIQGRITAFKSLLGAAGALIPAVPPAAAPARLGLADAQRILTNSAYGINADALQTVTKSHIGDIEVGAKFLVIDPFHGDMNARYKFSGFKYRSSLQGTVRLPTGQADAPQNFVDVGTGQGQTDLQGAWSNDLMFTDRLWASVIVRGVAQLKDHQFVRIIDQPDRELAPSYRQFKVERDLGDYVEFEANPRIALNDYFGIAGHYFYRRKQEDKYAGQFTVDPGVTGLTTPLALNANTLNLETQTTEHRVGGGLSFSTLAAYEKGTAKIPVEFTYFHWQTTRGTGNVPKAFTDQFQVRLYARAFGGSAPKTDR